MARSNKVTKQQKVRPTTIDFPEALYLQLKAQAAKRRTSLRAIVVELLEHREDAAVRELPMPSGLRTARRAKSIQD
jgi:macrodomain Ter protein organizer (MatP/YcbG family)